MITGRDGGREGRWRACLCFCEMSDEFGNASCTSVPQSPSAVPILKDRHASSMAEKSGRNRGKWRHRAQQGRIFAFLLCLFSSLWSNSLVAFRVALRRGRQRSSRDARAEILSPNPSVGWGEAFFGVHLNTDQSPARPCSNTLRALQQSPNSSSRLNRRTVESRDRKARYL